MEAWKAFEKNIETHSRLLKIPCVKIPDKILITRKGTIRNKVAFDFSACVEGMAVYFDAKCESEGRTFGLKSRVFNEKKIHQWSYLTEFNDGGAICGFLIWFVSMNKFVWANVETVKGALARDEKSITPETEGVVVCDDSDPIDLRVFTNKDRQLWKKKHFQSNS